MKFETENDVLKWYEGQERLLTPSFISTIPWKDIPLYELKPEFLPVLVYMRDVEKLTEVYHRQLTRTPTGKNPVVKRFLERWKNEEDLHGDLLNRFLEESGYPTNDRWYEKTKSEIPLSFRMENWITPLLTKWIGERFSAVHMTWGAIQEYTTLSGYQRLWQLARHPVLEYLLKAIAREEALHSTFYWNIARMRLKKSAFCQRITRFFVNRFWRPVGQGLRRPENTRLVIKTMFGDAEGIDFIDRKVNQRLEALPGLHGMKKVTNTVASFLN